MSMRGQRGSLGRWPWERRKREGEPRGWGVGGGGGRGVLTNIMCIWERVYLAHWHVAIAMVTHLKSSDLIMASIRETITLDAMVLASDSAPLSPCPPKGECPNAPRESFNRPGEGKRDEVCCRENSATQQNSLENEGRQSQIT